MKWISLKLRMNLRKKTTPLYLLRKIMALMLLTDIRIDPELLLFNHDSKQWNHFLKAELRWFMI